MPPASAGSKGWASVGEEDAPRRKSDATSIAITSPSSREEEEDPNDKGNNKQHSGW